MSTVSTERLPDLSGPMETRRDARATLAAYEAFLEHPAFAHRVDLAVLTKIATDEHMPVRERRRAAEALGLLRLRAMALIADLGGVREQILDELGVVPSRSGVTNVSVTQVNAPMKVEIVREDDWRGGGDVRG